MNARPRWNRCVALLALLCSQGFALGAAPDVADPHWGCYDALPAHPTPAEKDAFIAELAPLAVAAEANGGPPAAALLAMSALESGFGWTRIAIYANNLFGWKFVSPQAAHGRASWTLQCQPESDKNKRYIVFRDRADAIAFVAERLTTSNRYRAVTARYHADRAQGVDAQTAVASWARGIAAAGYNPFPDYPAKVLRLANNYRQPGATASSDASLFRHAAAREATTGRPPASSMAQDAARSVLAKRLHSVRYLSAECDARALTDWPGYAGRNVTRCRHSVTGAGKKLDALVYLLNPSADNIAARVHDACSHVGLAGHGGCGRYLATMIVDQNGGQFPVAGFVIERKRDAGGRGDDPVYLEFRDGTTIQSSDRLNFTDRQLTIEAMEHAARAPVVETRTIARIANATRADYQSGGGTVPVGNSPRDDTGRRWPEAVRANELHAQDTGEDGLLRGVAIRLRTILIRAK